MVASRIRPRPRPSPYDLVRHHLAAHADHAAVGADHDVHLAARGGLDRQSVDDLTEADDRPAGDRHFAERFERGHVVRAAQAPRWRQPREVLAQEFPEIAGGFQLHVPDEKSRRVGQAVAAASLPAIKK